MRLGSCVAVALVQSGGYGSDETPSLGPYATGAAQEKAKRPKKKKKKKKERKKERKKRQKDKTTTNFVLMKKMFTWFKTQKYRKVNDEKFCPIP